MTAFCTSEQQARWFGRIALKLRKKVDHGITFETTPQAAMNLQPGEYFKVASKVTHTDRFQSGSVTDSGDVISSEATRASSIRSSTGSPAANQRDTATLNISARQDHTDRVLRDAMGKGCKSQKTPACTRSKLSATQKTVWYLSLAALSR